MTDSTRGGWIGLGLGLGLGIGSLCCPALAQTAPQAPEAPRAPAAPAQPPSWPAENLEKPTVPPPAEGSPLAVERLRSEAGRMMGLLSSEVAKKLLLATTWLPLNDDRVVFWNRASRRALTFEQWAALPVEEREGWRNLELSHDFYYFTRYGSPLAFGRALDIAAMASKDSGLALSMTDMAGAKVLDFGFGSIGHLRLMASLGAHVMGVEVDPVLGALYSDASDTGTIPGALIPAQPEGSLAVKIGSWPADPAVAEAVGGGFDLVVSKNTLKKGYINPEKQVDPRLLVHLNMPNEAFLAHVAGSLKEGGLFLIYNISPRQSEDPEKWIPWADGRSPFSREQFEAAGFEVMELDKDDTEMARRIGAALGWDEQGMDLENNLKAEYTLVRKAGAAATQEPKSK